MDLMNVFWLVLSLAFLNLVVYYLFEKLLIKGNAPAMRFLGVNILKDVIWAGSAIYLLPREKVSFFLVTVVFIISSTVIYYKVIRRLNRH